MGEIEKTCKCQKIVISKKTLKPGEVGVIWITLDYTGKSDVSSVSAVVNFVLKSSKVKRKCVINLKTKIKDSWSWGNGVIDFGTFENRRDIKERLIFIKPESKGVEHELSSAHSSSSHVSVDLMEVPKGGLGGTYSN